MNIIKYCVFCSESDRLYFPPTWKATCNIYRKVVKENNNIHVGGRATLPFLSIICLYFYPRLRRSLSRLNFVQLITSLNDTKEMPDNKAIVPVGTESLLNVVCWLFLVKCITIKYRFNKRECLTIYKLCCYCVRRVQLLRRKIHMYCNLSPIWSMPKIKILNLKHVSLPFKKYW